MKNSLHSMTSGQASRVKRMGHARETKRLSQLDGMSKIIKGTGKADILRGDGMTESVKGGKKTQWALYTIDRILVDGGFTEQEVLAFKNWVNYIPTDKNEWERNRKFYSLNPNIIDLVNVFKNNPMKLINYFCGVDIVNYLVTEDNRNGGWIQTSMSDFSNKIKENIKNVYHTDGGKLVISGGIKNTILFELEIRKGKTSHKGILFHSHLHRIIDCLK